MFRSMRFGITEAHGRGTAVQWNWIREKGGITPTADGHFTIDVAKFHDARITAYLHILIHRNARVRLRAVEARPLQVQD